MFPNSMEGVCRMDSFKNECLSPFQYISFLSVIIRYFSVYDQQLVVENLIEKNLLGNKRYVFHSSTSTSDVLITITDRITEALNYKLVIKLGCITEVYYTNSPAIESLEEF